MTLFLIMRQYMGMSANHLNLTGGSIRNSVYGVWPMRFKRVIC